MKRYNIKPTMVIESDGLIVKPLFLEKENGEWIKVSDLKEECLKYDVESGSYPESEYEGYSVYDDITGCNITQDEWFENMKTIKAKLKLP